MITDPLPDNYTQFWGRIERVFIGLSVAIIASNLIAAGAMVWAAMKLTGGK